MLIRTQNVMAARCPQCGKTDHYVFSRLKIGRRQTAQFFCKCGTLLFSVSWNEPDVYSIEMECLICGKPHFFTFTKKEFWNNELKPLLCSNADIEIGFTGPAEKTAQAMELYGSHIRGILQDYNNPGFYCDFAIMSGVLSRLEALDFMNKIRCACGSSQLDFRVFPDKVEIRCPHCHAASAAPAASLSDLKWVKAVEEIHLLPISRRLGSGGSLNEKNRVN
jgi:predicted RNA-binding Zn-ribbon protein involved in translation (DUF1610 family)